MLRAFFWFVILTALGIFLFMRVAGSFVPEPLKQVADMLRGTPAAPAPAAGTGSGATTGTGIATGSTGTPASPATPPPLAPGEVRVQLDEATLTRQLNAGLAGQASVDTPFGRATARDLAVKLQDGQISVTGNAVVGGTALPVTIGAVPLVEAGKVRVSVTEARIGGFMLPQSVRQTIEGNVQTQLDQALARQPMRISRVAVAGGTLTITGAPA